VPDLRALRDAAAALLPDAAIAVTDPRAVQPALLDEEILRAIPARQREFAAGRAAARQAMRVMGLPAAAIAVGRDRAPVWPAGLAGSITHSATACVAAIARGGLLGIDIEPDVPLDRDIWPAILLPEEQRWLATQPDRGHRALQIFCAKEAAYKAQYPATATLFGFDTLHVILTHDRFTATFRKPAGPIATGFCLHGRITRVSGHVFAAVHLPEHLPWNKIPQAAF
jgi:4'-phosphopantetheinyl transferase EntD